MLCVNDYAVFFFLKIVGNPNLVLISRSKTWITVLISGLNTWITRMEEGYIQYNFVSKLIVGIGDVQLYSTNFAPELFSLNSIQGLKMSPLCSRLLGLFWSGTLGFWVANRQGQFGAWGTLLHFSFLFRIVFLVWLANRWGSSFAFCFFNTNSNSTPPCKCPCSFLLSIFPHPPATRSISTRMEWFRSTLSLFFGLSWLQTGTATVSCSLLFSSPFLDSRTPPLTPNSKPPLSAYQIHGEEPFNLI